MNETPQALSFALMQLGIGTRSSLSLASAPTEETWKAVMRMAQKQAVSGIVMDGILKLPEEYLPPTPIRLKGIQQLLQIELLNRRLNREAVQVSEYLQAEGYACTILKGQGIARYYPIPFHRMPGDIDVWPDAEQGVLRKYYHKFPQTNNHPFHIHLSLLKETDVELHFQPSHMFNPVTNRRLLAFCRKHRSACAKNRVTLEGNKQTVAVATDVFNRVYLPQHILRHLFGEGIGLRQLMDYGQVLRKGMTEAEKEEAMQTLSSLNMRGFMGAVMYVLQTVFALEERYLLCPPNEKKGKLLLKEILEGGNFGHYDTRGNRRNLLNKVKRRMYRLFRIYSLAPSEASWAFLFFTRSFFKQRIHRILLREQTDSKHD